MRTRWDIPHNTPAQPPPHTLSYFPSCTVLQVAVCNLASIVLPKFVSKRTTLAVPAANGAADADDEAVLVNQSPNDSQLQSASSSAAAASLSALPLHCGVYHVTDETETAAAIQPSSASSAAASSSATQPLSSPHQQPPPLSPIPPQLQGGYIFDHHRLYEVTKVITRNLNRIIDTNYYPIEQARNSNMRHRPIGIGVQGTYLVS